MVVVLAATPQGQLNANVYCFVAAVVMVEDITHHTTTSSDAVLSSQP
jgi:hypothetical protein